MDLQKVVGRFLQFLGKVRLVYRLGGRVPAARQARGPSAAAMIIIISSGYFVRGYYVQDP